MRPLPRCACLCPPVPSALRPPVPCAPGVLQLTRVLVTRAAQLKQQLTASKQAVSRLEHELSSARSAAAAERDRPRTPRAAPSAAPPPPPPPPPPAVSPSLKKAAAEAAARVCELEAEVREVHRSANGLRAEVRRLESELARRPQPGAADQHEAALRRCRSELEEARRELSEEREMRRSLERRLGDTARRAPAAPLRVPEPPPPPRPYTEDDAEYDAAKAEATRQAIDKLDGRLGKLERRKVNHEQQLQVQLTASQRQVAELQSQLRAANALAVQRGLAATKASPRVSLFKPKASPRALRAAVPTQPRPPSPRDALVRSALLLGAADDDGEDVGAASEPVDLAILRAGRGGGGGGGGAGGGGKSREERTVARLQQLDPHAAAAIATRKEQMNALRQRLVDAQAEVAVEAHEAHYVGARPARVSVA